MNPRIKELWVKALRSGEYRQGNGRLRVNDRYCCLGVLTDLYCKETGSPWKKVANEFAALLPGPARDWAYLDNRSPRLSDGTALWELNDIRKYTFPEIADLIEAHL